MNSGARKKKDWPEKVASVEPPTDMVDAAISTPEHQRRRESPMKIRAGWTFRRQEPEAAAQGDHRDERADVAGDEDADVVEADGVIEEGARGDGHDPGGRGRRGRR